MVQNICCRRDLRQNCFGIKCEFYNPHFGVYQKRHISFLLYLKFSLVFYSSIIIPKIIMCSPNWKKVTCKSPICYFPKRNLLLPRGRSTRTHVTFCLLFEKINQSRKCHVPTDRNHVATGKFPVPSLFAHPVALSLSN